MYKADISHLMARNSNIFLLESENKATLYDLEATFKEHFPEYEKRDFKVFLLKQGSEIAKIGIDEWKSRINIFAE